MSGFKPYPAYKDSGVAWLGEVPEHWATGALRWYADIQGGIAKGKDYQGRDTISLPYLRVANVQDGFVDLTEVKEISVLESDLERYSLRPGDVLMNEGGDNDKLGRGAVWQGQIKPCLHQNHVFAIRPNELLTPGWLAAFSGGQSARAYFFLNSKQSTNLASISASNIMSLVVPISPLAEQAQILRFLDHETARIDALIEEQQRLIELLKEKRQAVTSHAVTKGLDPTVPMKDSGVEWLGEVPEHWDVKRVKHITLSFDQGWSPQCENQPVDDDKQPGVLKTGCVNGGVFKHNENKKLPDDLGLIYSLTVRAGDLLVSRANTRELVGSAAVPSISYPNLMIPDKIFRIRVKEKKANSRFIAFYLGSPFARREIELSATGASSSMLNISQSAIADMLFPCPPVLEQNKIVGHIVEETYRLLALAEDALSLKKLLQERRSALISAAVTGKIDVRNWQPAEQCPVGDAANRTELEAV